MLGHYFCPPSGSTHLIAAAEGIDSRTRVGRIAIEVLRCVARSDGARSTPRKLMPASSGSVEPRRLRAVGYIRVSADQRSPEGVRRAAQRARIRAHCVRQEIELVALIIDDGHSAKSPLGPPCPIRYLSRCRERDDASTS